MKRILPLSLLLPLAACASRGVLPGPPAPLPAESADRAPLVLRVEGVVVDRYGYAVPDASVTVRVGSPERADAVDGCPSATYFPTRTRTTPLGRFDLVVEAGRRAPFHACIEVEAIPPPRSGLVERAVVVPSAAFEPVGADGVPRTIRVRVDVL